MNVLGPDSLVVSIDLFLCAFCCHRIYIENKRVTDMTGVESWVRRHLLRDDSSWIPSNALCFREEDTADDNAHAQSEVSHVKPNACMGDMHTVKHDSYIPSALAANQLVASAFPCFLRPVTRYLLVFAIAFVFARCISDPRQTRRP